MIQYIYLTGSTLLPDSHSQLLYAMTITELLSIYIPDRGIIMNRLNIYQNIHKEQTVVSNCFIDDYMAEANDAQLKIYLFLIRINSTTRKRMFFVLSCTGSQDSFWH